MPEVVCVGFEILEIKIYIVVNVVIKRAAL